MRKRSSFQQLLQFCIFLLAVVSRHDDFGSVFGLGRSIFVKGVGRTKDYDRFKKLAEVLMRCATKRFGGMKDEEWSKTDK